MAKANSIDRTGAVIRIVLGVFAIIGTVATLAIGFAQIGSNTKVCDTVPVLKECVLANRSDIDQIIERGSPNVTDNSTRITKLETKFEVIDQKLDKILESVH